MPTVQEEQLPDGESAQKFVMVAYNIARAYDNVVHRFLRAHLTELGVPACMNTWVWRFLSDRRACVGVNGTESIERVYRASLPQGSETSWQKRSPWRKIAPRSTSSLSSERRPTRPDTIWSRRGRATQAATVQRPDGTGN